MIKTNTKKKLCWNCEGNVPREAENCPYCAVYLNPTHDEDEAKEEHYAHTPPYPLEKEEVVKQSVEKSEVEEVHPESNETVSDFKTVLLPLSSLLSGTVFFLFSFILYLYSDQKLFTLQWHTTYWYLYLFASVILLVIGWRSLQNLSEAPKE